MIDIIPDRYRMLAGGLLLLAWTAGAAFSGWHFRGIKADAEIAALQVERATEREQQATAALTTLKADADAIHQAATEYAAIETTLAPKIAALTKELRNAKPLPADCRPDDYRVRNLDAAIDAANQAIPR